MDNWGLVIILTVLAYFIGNFSSAFIISKTFAKEDIRTKGSGNAGTANMFRNYGYKLAIATLALDILKGYLAVVIANKLGGQTAMYFAAVAVVMGHNWPVVLKFKGGKGVATSIGVMFAVNWQATLIVFIAGILVIILTKRVAIASVLGFILYPFAIFLMYPDNVSLKITVLILGVLGVYSHRSNIKRLIKGEETKVSFKRGGERRNLK